MVIGESAEFGMMLGKLAVDQDNLNQNISPDEAEGFTQLFMAVSMELHATEIINKLTYATDSFVLDHPSLGELDSSVLKIDGGYDGSGTVQLSKTEF